jgi:hypothetical protein
MKYLIAILFALVPSVAMSQVMSKENMIMEYTDIASLAAAEVLGCGKINKKNVKRFNTVFDGFMLYKAEEEGYNVTIEDIEAWKLAKLIEQYNAMKGIPCSVINESIDEFNETVRYTREIYDYYTPAGGI